MVTQVITQLIVDASGAQTGTAAFTAAMDIARQKAVEAGNATAQAFESVQRRWTVSLGQTDPVIKAQIAMEDALAKQRLIGNKAVELGIATQAAAAAQLEKVRQNREADITAIKEHAGQLSKGDLVMSAFSKGLNAISLQLVAMTAGFGPLSVFFAAMGPWGIAAAIALTALGAAINFVSEGASRMGARSIELQQFKLVTDLTIAQIGTLRNAGSNLGVSGDTVAAAFEKMTAGLVEARRASGALYEGVQQVDGGLALQLRQSLGTASAIDALARAYKAAGDESTKASIARAAFGRGGAALGPVLGTIADAGGLQALTDRMGKLNEATDDQTKRWAEMSAQIDETKKRAQNILGSIITDRGLQAQKFAADEMERMARAAKAMFDQGQRSQVFQEQMQGLTSGQRMRVARTGQMAALTGASPEEVAQKTAALTAQMKGQVDPATMKLAQTLDDIAAAASRTAPAVDAATTSLKRLQDAAAADAKDLSERVSFLGAAATLDDQRAARLATITSLYRDNKTGVTDATKALDLYNRALAGENAAVDLQKLQARVSLLGPLASVGDQVSVVQGRINQENTKGITITREQRDGLLAIAAANAEWALTNAKASAGVFDLRTATKAAGDELRGWIAQGLLDPKNPQQMANAHEILAMKIQRTKQTAEEANPILRAMADLTFQRMLEGMDSATAAAAQMSRQLFGPDWQSHMNDAVVQMAAFNERLKEAKGFTNDFGQALIQNLAQGKSLADSLAASFNNLGSAIASKAMSSGVAGLFGGAGGSGGLDISSMVNQFKAMANAMTISLNDAMSGAAKSMSQSTAGGGESPSGAVTGGGGSFGAIGNIAVAIGISLLQGQAAKLKQAVADFKDAQDAWAKMAGEVKTFTDSLTGNAGGSFTTALDDAKTKAQSYADAAHKAGQNTDSLNAALTTFADHLARDFIGAFDVMNEALNQGLGTDSPAVKAQQNIKQVGEQLKAFIVDTQNVVALTSGGAAASAGSSGASGIAGVISQIADLVKGTNVAAAAPIDQGGAVAAAQASSQKYLLSLLQTPPVLSDVSTKLLTLRGTAAQLQLSLQDLGMSATDAAAAVASGITKALDQMKADFTSNLTSKINAATGKGYVNDLNNLITESLGMLTDAKNLGTDPKQVAQYFQAQAQSIVDSAGLVGSSFDDMVKVFPELAGVVGQSRTAITQFQGAISDFLASLQTGNLSALSPQDKLASARTSYQGTLMAAQGGDQAAMGKLTQSASDFLTQAKDYYASSADYAAIFLQVNRDLGSVAASSKTTNQQLGSIAQNSGSTVLHLASVDQSTDQTAVATDATASATDAAAQTLSVLQGLQDATKSASVDISASVAQLGAQSQDISTTQSSQYFGPMVTYLSQIANNTLLQGQAATPPPDSFEWWNPFTWFAEGGKVTGGTPGRDSVMGLLTPGEIVMNENISRQFEPLLLAMNNGHLPRFADGGMVGAIGGSPSMPTLAFAAPNWQGGANDNRAHFEYLAKEFRSTIRDLARASDANTSALADRIERLEVAQYAGAKQISDTNRIVGNRTDRPGTKVA